MTLTIEAPPSTVAKWESLSEEERERRARAFIEDIEADDDSLPYLPPPGFAEVARLAREARGDFRSAAEILRQERDEADKRREAVFRGEA